MELFTQQQIPERLISRLQKQFPKTYEIDEFLDLPPVLYSNTVTNENFWFTTALSSDVAVILDTVGRTGVGF